MAMQQPTSMSKAMKTARWQDWVILAAAVCLFISPWIVGYGGGGQTFTAVSSSMSEPGVTGGLGGERNYFDAGLVAGIYGVILAVLAILNIYRIPVAEEYLFPALGAWVIATPWILGQGSSAGFGGAQAGTVTWVFGIVGLVVLIASLLENPLLFGGSPEAGAGLAHAGEKPRTGPEGPPKSY
jgi:hypothetical protein